MFLDKFRKKNLHIFLRHVHIYNPEAKARPSWFSIESCFLNLISTLSKPDLPLKVDLTVMFDGDDTSFNDDFLSTYMKNHGVQFPVKIKIVQFHGGSDARSFHHTIDYILDQNYSDDDWIYFLENDYLHVPNWINKLSDLFDVNKNHEYVSLYDHFDKYLYDQYDELESKIRFHGNHHWRSTPSTCASFLVTSKILNEDAQIIKTGGGDHEFFTALANKNSRKIISPIPGLSTHCMKDFLSPGIDWENISNSSKTI
ncbi:hypothetical protein G6731_08160 [Polynucleobacter paneuropaeus]|uniref:Uncharacterized protein n=1 Tax=Polynucleobacter paneuropaeus TaxID=2527775 RepID=A0A9Q2WJ90_9BURK|nr:hypothetical protein [Polynucleobacter paneuropaeus]